MNNNNKIRQVERLSQVNVCTINQIIVDIWGKRNMYIDDFYLFSFSVYTNKIFKVWTCEKLDI